MFKVERKMAPHHNPISVSAVVDLLFERYQIQSGLIIQVDLLSIVPISGGIGIPLLCLLVFPSLKKLKIKIRFTSILGCFCVILVFITVLDRTSTGEAVVRIIPQGSILCFGGFPSN